MLVNGIIILVQLDFREGQYQVDVALLDALTAALGRVDDRRVRAVIASDGAE